jgi:hypothetical protein
MTIVICFSEKHQMFCAADSRLSSGPQTITDSGGKISIIPITKATCVESAAPEYEHYSLGFAYAGSSLLANNTHFIASTCSQIIKSENPGLPRAQLIARIYAGAAEHVTKDVNSRMNKDHLYFQAFIFGHCPVEKRFKLFTLSPDLSNNKFKINVENIDISDGQGFAIGSGQQEFTRRMGQKNPFGYAPQPLEVLKSMLDENPVKDVGGYLQVAIATVGAVTLQPILIPNPENPDIAALTINGFDTAALGSMEGFSFGLNALSHGMSKVQARLALRTKGIDPDSPNIATPVQNSASFERALHAVRNTSNKLLITERYTLDPPKPTSGAHYFVAKCHNCNVDTPLVVDHSEGELGNPFQGNGELVACCWLCGKSIFAKTNDIKSIKWRFP